MPIAKRIAWGVLVGACPALVVGQPLVPLADEVSKPLLPTGILRHDVHIQGQLAYLFQTDAGEHVIHVAGDFEMKMGGRTLKATQAVIWLSPRRFEDMEYRRYEVFLARGARVVEPAGTVSEGPLLFVTLNSTGELTLSADRRAFASSADTAVYRDALAVREQVRQGLPAGGPGPTPGGVVPLAVTPLREEPPPQIHYTARETTFSRLEDGRQVLTGIGEVYFFRGATRSVDALELQADAAVVFLKLDDGGQAGRAPDAQADESMQTALDAAGVAANYLEGDIRMAFGERTIRASRLYYDLVQDRALILDAVAFGMIPKRDVPLYLRAAQIRQLSSVEYSADRAIVTTSEFHTPHYHIGAEHVTLIDQTPRSPLGGPSGLGATAFRMRHVTFNLYNLPIMYWPFAAGRVAEGEVALRGISVGASDDFGLTVETEWDLFSLLSFEPPRGFDAELRLDYYSDRGAAVGLDLDYERDHYFGLYRSYVIDDHGKDNLGRFRAEEPDTDVRGRWTWRHRHHLPDDWELTFEISYLSDRAFLEEYFEREFDEGKDQETLIYAKKQRDNWAFTAIAQWRLNDFLTQTERLPELSFRLIGEPLGDWGTFFSENRTGFIRYRAAEKELFLLIRRGSDGPSSGAVGRMDSRQELEFPLTLGPVKVVPFASFRRTAWDDSMAGGGRSRLFATYGVRAGMYLSRVFPDFESDLLDVHGIRHVIKTDVIAWASDSNRDSDELFPFDQGVEGIDDFDGVTVGVRQRWQTKRGPPEDRRIVDWLTFDAELGLFNNAPGTRDLRSPLSRLVPTKNPRRSVRTNGFTSFTRPENSVARNYVNTALIWRLNDATALFSEMNYDLNDGEVDILNLSLAVDRTPRFSYMVGYRFIEENDSNLLGIGFNYRLDEKHTIAVRESFDLDRGDTLDFTVGYIRKYPRWYVAVSFELDESESDAGVSFSVWPEGLPRATIGSRRFTGVAGSTALTTN
ncbi:MAG: LPS assembly protein LptD [Planctomycetes bacterium]|nr:LPS assembly protein LptD [Planctomycetota bacterium]